MKAKQFLVAGVLAVSVAATAFVQTASASLVGDVLKGGGIVYLVDAFSDQLNKFVNTLTLNNGVSSDGATKVVPIISIGNGTYVGAAQVTGPQEKVDATKAVLQIGGNFNDDRFQVKALVPIDRKSITGFKRVQGVGVSAQIDVKI
jgi:hypothetical protein